MLGPEIWFEVRARSLHEVGGCVSQPKMIVGSPKLRASCSCRPSCLHKPPSYLLSALKVHPSYYFFFNQNLGPSHDPGQDAPRKVGFDGCTLIAPRTLDGGLKSIVDPKTHMSAFFGFQWSFLVVIELLDSWS